MRASLLLPLLLLGVSSQDDTKQSTASPSENVQKTTATSTSNTQRTTSTSSPANPQSTAKVSPTTAPGTNSLTTPAISPLAVQRTTPTSKTPPNPATSSAAVQRTSPTPTTSTMSSQLSSGSGASAANPAATSSTNQTSSAASLGSLAATTAASPAATRVISPTAAPGSLGPAVTSSSSMQAQGSQPSNQSTSTTVSTGVSTSSLSPGLKNYGVFSPTSITKQPQPSPSSPVHGLVSSTKPGSINTSVTPFAGSVSSTTSKATLTLSPGSVDKVSKAATTQTTGADQRSQTPGSVPTKPASADQSPASAQPSAPVPGDQTASSCPGHQHLNASFQNEVICKDQVQNNWPTMYLKEARTCAEWRTASVNISFFESFCSTGQHVFNASRESCTVMLTSREPRSQHWAVQAVVHLPLDPEKVLEELKEKDKLEELGIVNVTYDKMEREMIINDEFSTPLIITIVTLAGSLLLIAAIYGCCHQRFSQKKDQHIHPDVPGFDDGHVALIFNRLTEELQTMENGYHDNPTLEVMETSSEMQEKKVNLNGELGDSWIVPLDTLMKEDLEEEEDTHL
ncbi:podocalyxin isoform X2 [Cuculus canorus]|uniref:podocalyxin isoform X2 n=1 Tax=Cuculus canorus TaxID=55661 RepID=UPI0023AA69CB|nr:podocalyxin isoform X2 [Cuculus canorus]